MASRGDAHNCLKPNGKKKEERQNRDNHEFSFEKKTITKTTVKATAFAGKDFATART